MLEPSDEPSFAGDLRAAWAGFVDLIEPLRPDLYSYCRRLTGSVWDAEDLVQDTLLRAFGRWGAMNPAINDPRAYLQRTATNVWIDRLRHRETEANAQSDATGETSLPAETVERSSLFRDAGSRLLGLLSPQEMVALVLKESFDMTLEDIADLLRTSTGAVKAALHRARDRVKTMTVGTARQRPVSKELIDRFIARFEARDVEGLLALMLKSGVAENVGNSFHEGLKAPSGLPRFFKSLVFGHKEWPAETHYDSARLEYREIDGEPVALMFIKRRDREALMSVFRFEEADGRVARVRSYGFCPDTIRAIGKTLGVPVFTGLYRAPTPMPDGGASTGYPPSV
jgi:RNA polymerase sigma-70 factor (ECF subfamily)